MRTWHKGCDFVEMELHHLGVGIDLTPRDHSTAGKIRLGVITRAGDEALRSALVVGATSVIHRARTSGKVSPWLAELLKRKPPRLLSVIR